MKCKIIKLKHEYDSTIPRIEEFETIKEIKGHSLYNLIQNNVNKSDCWMLITSNDHGLQNNLYRVFSDHSYTSLGKLQPSVETKNSPLTFDTLRKANVARLPEFKNSKGLSAHSKEDGSDWSPAQWLQAVIGELGEYANVMKKVERGDLTFEEAKPLIEKELADVMTYLDILAFRIGVDLAKAVEQKFNEVSERVGCSLRIANNEVVRKPDMNSVRTKCGTSIFENYDYDPKNGELTPKQDMKINTKTEQTITYPTGTVTKIINQYSNGTTITVSNLNVEITEDSKLEIKNTVKPKMSEEEFKAAKEACKISPKEFAEKQRQKPNNFICFDIFRQMYHQEWVEQCKQYTYPLQISRNQVEDIFGFEFQGLDNGKQYLFYFIKKIIKENGPLWVLAVPQSYLFEYFSKQLGTKIVGMLINGHKENKILNPNDTVQFYDDRNVLYNFRLVKSSDKNVGVSLS